MNKNFVCILLLCGLVITACIACRENSDNGTTTGTAASSQQTGQTTETSDTAVAATDEAELSQGGGTIPLFINGDDEGREDTQTSSKPAGSADGDTGTTKSEEASQSTKPGSGSEVTTTPSGISTSTEATTLPSESTGTAESTQPDQGGVIDTAKPDQDSDSDQETGSGSKACCDYQAFENLTAEQKDAYIEKNFGTDDDDLIAFLQWQAQAEKSHKENCGDSDNVSGDINIGDYLP